jgi:hypothetical protein
MKHPEPDGILNVAARTVGHAAGKVAIAFGLEETEAKPAKAPKKGGVKSKSGKRVSARSNRIARAAVAKKTAVALGKDFGSGDQALPAHRWQDSGWMVSSRCRLCRAINVRQKARGPGVMPGPLAN